VSVPASTGSDAAVRSRRESLGFALGVAAVIALAAALGLRDLGSPGLYYDEAIQAVPAAEFLRASARPFELPGTWNARIAGRWFPVLTQPYMGALKSQLLIPVFAAFGASVESLRAATFGFGLLGLGLAMLFARSLLGTPVALVGGLLLAVDPAFLLVSRHDWGSFSLGLACRCGGLWLAVTGFERRSAARLAGAGLAFGVGVYNKLDAVAFLAAAACAIVLVAPRAVGERLRRRPGEFGALAACLLLGAAPLLPSAWKTLRYLNRAFRMDSGVAHDLPEKLSTWSTLFDGSHFERLMLAGGRFEALSSVEGAVASLFLPALVASAVAVAAGLAVRRPWQRVERAQAFVLATLVLAIAGLLAMPGAVRIHHALNVTPLPQLVVACAVVDLWRRAGRARASAVGRALLALALAALVASELRADLATLAEIRDHGGRGRWSDALGAFAHELEAEHTGPVVSLDWGFHAQLSLLAPELDLREPIWAMRPATGGFQMEGPPGTVYLVQDPRYHLFPFGDELLAAVSRLPEGAVSIRGHADRSGENAFFSIRIDRPHRLVRREVVEIVLE